MNELEKKILKVATKAVKQAQFDSLQRGVANVYSKNKRIYFQLPDGTITEQIPVLYQSSSQLDSVVE
jgi:hypothetical protein